MNKYERFWNANKGVGAVTLTEEISSALGKYGAFHVDNADIILVLSRQTGVSPEVIAVTWLNETTFRFVSEPNKNGKPDYFDSWDVGPMQINVYWTKADIRVGRIRASGTEQDMFGSVAGADVFNGNPLVSMKTAVDRLAKMGRGRIVAKKDDKEYEMFPAVSVEAWKTLPQSDKDARRAVDYTGPEARPSRLNSWNRFGPLFKKFFEVYGQA